MSIDRQGGPPAAVRWLLGMLLPEEDREFYLGDLEESRRPWAREVLGAAAMRLAFLTQQMLSDLRLGLRRLMRTPAATLGALTALAVGIGLSGLMFSLVSSGFLPTLPFEAGDRIVRVKREDASISAEAFAYWRERQRSFEGLSAGVELPVNLAIEGERSGLVYAAAVDPAAFPLLSVQPVVGRGFSESDAAPGAPAVVVVGWELWRTRLNGDPGVLGRTVRLNGEPAEIIGVMPDGFGFPTFDELWMPLRLDVLRPDRNPASIGVFGVLRRDVSLDAATSELNDLERERPRTVLERDAPPVEVRAYTDIVNPRGRTEQLAGVMLVVALLVLTVACANATNVLLAQAVVRSREVAIRAALGATRWRIAALVWAEVSLLAFAGAAAGVLLTVLGLRLVRNAIPPEAPIPFWIDLRVDVPVLVFIAVAAVLAALVAGGAPALHAARANRQDLLTDATRGTSSRRLGRLMGRLIAVEMAVSFVLLVAAGLFIRSAVNVQSWRFPFEPEGVYTVHVRLPDGRYEDAAARAALSTRLEEELAGIGGGSTATLATAVPGIMAARRSVAVQGVHDPADPDLPATRYIAASAPFFELFRAPLLEGRAFDARDRHDELAVAIVNSAFAERYLPGGAIGRRIALPAGEADEWLTIVGIVPDLMPSGLERDIAEAVYRPFAQDPAAGFQVIVRSNLPPDALHEPVRLAVAGADPDLALYFPNMLDRAIHSANSGFAWVSALFLVAGVLALFLAAIGLYGVMAFWVAQRTREIGVRMAIGGSRATIFGLVLRQAMARIGLGILAGVLVAAPLAWLIQGALLDVPPFDPLVFGLVLGVLVAAGSLGCALPALRATRVNPQAALAAE